MLCAGRAGPVGAPSAVLSELSHARASLLVPSCIMASMLAARGLSTAATLYQGRRCNQVPCSARRQQAPKHRRSFTGKNISPGRSPSISCQSAGTEVGKLLTKTEIPAFIPRTDLIDQLLRWAIIEIQESGMANVGMPCKVTPFYHEGLLWGFTVSFLKDGVSANDVRVAFDEEIVLKHEWVGRGADGFPMLEGNSEEVMGKHFEIRKVDDRAVSDQTRTAIRDFVQMMVAAINKYYAFGSAFAEDST